MTPRMRGLLPHVITGILAVITVLAILHFLPGCNSVDAVPNGLRLESVSPRFNLGIGKLGNN